MNTAVIVEIVGWAGSLLLVVSLLQSKMLRLRILNLTASVILVAYNLVVGVWPMAAMNAAVVFINITQIVRIQRATPQLPVDLTPVESADIRNSQR